MFQTLWKTTTHWQLPTCILRIYLQRQPERVPRQQVFLPVKLGGNGTPSAVLTAPSAFLDSARGCEPFSQNLNLNLGSDRDVESALTAWYELSDVEAMPVAEREAQKTWSTPVLDKLQIDIEQSPDQTQSKRFSLTQGRYAGDWFNAIPMSPIGLKLTDGQLRCAVALRLGAKICAAHTCCCGQNAKCRRVRSSWARLQEERGTACPTCFLQWFC